jgi:hypothetical protein
MNGPATATRAIGTRTDFKRLSKRSGEEHFAEQRFPTFGFTISGPRMQLGSVPEAWRMSG